MHGSGMGVALTELHLQKQQVGDVAQSLSLRHGANVLPTRAYLSKLQC